MSNLDWFFRSSRSAPNRGERFSQLYLLRRDIDTCFGVNPNTGLPFCVVDPTTGARTSCEAIWPGTMAILAGIDLLGKFRAGTDVTRGPGSVSVRQRFVDFSRLYLSLSETDAYLVYHLRNSLLHSFGLNSEKTDDKGTVTATYDFILSRGAGKLLEHFTSDFYRVDVQCLRDLFERAIARYEAELRDNSRSDYQDLNDKFNAMFPKHAKPMSVI